MSLTRREFSKLGALGMAAQLLPVVRAEAQGGQRKVGYCVIGLGRIADHFMRGVKQGSTSQITGLVSGHRDKAERIAAEYGVPKDSIYSYEDMDRMRDNKAIDAVYVALPNSMHAEYTIRAAQAGKHVLCEKPMGMNASECQQMVQAALSAGVLLGIAQVFRFEESVAKVRDRVAAGEIGDPILARAEFSFPGSKHARTWLSDRSLAGGGPIADVGVHCIDALRYILQDEPTLVTACGRSDRLSGDVEAVAILFLNCYRNADHEARAKARDGNLYRSRRVRHFAARDHPGRGRHSPPLQWRHRWTAPPSPRFAPSSRSSYRTESTARY